MAGEDNSGTILTGPDPSEGDIAAKEAAQAETDAQAAKEAEAKKVYDALSPEEKVAADAKTAAEKKAKDETDAKAKETAEAKKEADAKAKAAKDAKGKGDKAKDGAPDEYEQFSIPQGMEIDKAALEAAMPVFKGLNLTQAQAQELVDLQSETVRRVTEAQEDTWDKTQDEWRKSASADKEVGGEKHDEHVAFAKRALDRVGNKALKDLLDVTGVGNHVEMIRFMSRVGRLIGDDKLHFGNVSGGEKTAGEVAKQIYDKSPELK